MFTLRETLLTIFRASFFSWTRLIDEIFDSQHLMRHGTYLIYSLLLQAQNKADFTRSMLRNMPKLTRVMINGGDLGWVTQYFIFMVCLSLKKLGITCSICNLFSIDQNTGKCPFRTLSSKLGLILTTRCLSVNSSELISCSFNWQLDKNNNGN